MAEVMINAAFAPFADQAPKGAKRRKARGPKVGRSLGGVVQQLRAAQPLMGGAVGRPTGRQATPRIPTGAQYMARWHRSAAGSRGYKLYLPASRPRRPKGLILMLHGCSQNPDDFAIGTHMNALAEKHGLAVAYPAQTRSRFNRASCWKWFRPTHQHRGVGEPAILASLTRKLMREFGIRRDGVFVAGLSAGGAMAVILADLYPEVFSAAGIHSGLARGSAHDVVSAMSTMRSGAASTGSIPAVDARALPVRRIIFQGAADRTVHPSNAGMIVAAAVGDDVVPTRTDNRSAGGREYARSEYAGADGTTLVEFWMIDGAGHAWSGGRPAGSYTDRKGPDASTHMLRFFMGKSA
ncbi:alpha/beta hydrolase family esterase [Alkalilacustris brevis]|uniref:extracellular catalytic domain type 1 short-chain-length polyhydroxyalkanoate depolymerase n=1 Tax=Alkalilacustris brevis TaxID=2026338 RepID=UPI001EE42DA1|nr:PHB depolymerase family esterase [Alkalilacustris brevis]